MAESGRGQPDGMGDWSSERGRLPEVPYSAVEVEDPPSPDPKKVAPGNRLKKKKKSMDFILSGRDGGGH